MFKKVFKTTLTVAAVIYCVLFITACSEVTRTMKLPNTGRNELDTYIINLCGEEYKVVNSNIDVFENGALMSIDNSANVYTVNKNEKMHIGFLEKNQHGSYCLCLFSNNESYSLVVENNKINFINEEKIAVIENCKV